MLWSKLAADFATHRKLLDAGFIALAIQVRAICYCTLNRTDGYFTANAIPLFLVGLEDVGVPIPTPPAYDEQDFGPALATDWPAHMVNHHLWDKTPHGYKVHDFLVYNLSVERQEKYIEDKKRAGRKGGKSKHLQEKIRLADALADAQADALAPDIASDIAKLKHATSTSKTTSSLNSPSLNPKNLSEEFSVFWEAYPRKVGKHEAERAYKRQKPGLPAALQAIDRAKQSEQWQRGIIPNPATWLNQGRWQDEGQPAPNTRQAEKPPYPGPHDPIARTLWRNAYGNPE